MGTFTGPPARLKFEGRSYMLDPDERQAFRGVEVIRADTDRQGAVEALDRVAKWAREGVDRGKIAWEAERAARVAREQVEKGKAAPEGTALL